MLVFYCGTTVIYSLGTMAILRQGTGMENERSWIERMADLEDGGEIGVGGWIVRAIRETEQAIEWVKDKIAEFPDLPSLQASLRSLEKRRNNLKEMLKR